MGDFKIGYAQNPELPISHMIAASAGFPVLIGPYILKTKGMRWTKDKWGRHEELSVDDEYSLWDGGVYDNLGLEALYKIGSGLDSEIDFLMVSNASASISHKERKRNVSASNIMRLLDITTSQIEILRSREVFASVISQGRGMYFKIGADAEKIAQSLGVSRSQAGILIDECLSPSDAKMCGDYPTTLKTPSQEDFDRILRHGCESAKCVHIFSEMARRNSGMRV
jgi:NTE family protein